MTVLSHDWYPGEVPGNVVLGKRSWLYSSFAFLHHRSEREPSVRIGPDSGVYVGSYFDLGPRGEVEIGRYCSIAGAVFSSNGRIAISDYTFISNGVVIADTFAAVPPDVREAVHEDGNSEPRDVIIGHDVWIGARAVVVGRIDVGNGAIIGAAAVVESDVPDYAIAVGNPASIVGWARPGGREGRFTSRA